MDCVQNTGIGKLRRGGFSILLSLPFVLAALLFQFWGNTYAGLDVRHGTASLFVWLVQRWNDSSVSFGGNYSHGWVIPVIAVWLVWRRRAEILATTGGQGGWLGGVAVMVGLTLHGMGLRAELPQISVVGLIVVIWGIPVFLWGGALGKLLLFPCAYLLFAVPVNIFDSLTFPLRLVATMTASGLLNALGVPVVRVGTAIHSTVAGGFHLDVADPCSGIRSLTALMAIVAVYGYVSQKTLLRKWLLFLLSFPAAVVGNIVRVLGIGFIAALMGEQVAVGVYHDYSGYFFYAAAVGVMLFAGSQLDRIPIRIRRPVVVKPEMVKDSLYTNSVSAWRALVLICVMVFAMGVAHWIVMTPIEMAASPLKTELPERLQKWDGVDVVFCTNMTCLRSIPVKEVRDTGVCPECSGRLDHMSCAERALLPSDTQIVRKLFEQEGDDPVLVTVVFSGRERSSIHRPEICLVSQGYRILDESRMSVPIRGRISLQVQVLELGAPRGGRQYFAYWFVGGAGRETPSHVWRILWMASDRIFMRRSERWAYVSVLFPASGPGGGGEALKQFIETLYPALLVNSGHEVDNSWK